MSESTNVCPSIDPACSESRLAAIAVMCVACLMTGCGPGGPTDAEMRTAVQQTLGLEPPASCQLLGFRTAGADGKSCLWVLHADEPLQLAPTVRPHIRRTIPLETLRTIVRDVAEADFEVVAPPDARCDFLEWTCNDMNCRLRQARTDAGWYASLEMCPDKD